MHESDLEIGIRNAGGHPRMRHNVLRAATMKRHACHSLMSIALLLLALVSPRLAVAETVPANPTAGAVEVSLDPVLDQLSVQNAALTRILQDQAAEFDQILHQREQSETLLKRIESALADIQGSMKVHGRTEGLGRLLLRQRESLPDTRSYVRRSRARQRQVAELGMQLLDFRDEARRMADLDQAVAMFETQIPAEKIPALREPLVVLVTQRRVLLGKAMVAHELYLTQLAELGASEKNLLQVVQTCEQFLDEQLLWLRSAAPTRWRDIKGLPGELRRWFAPAVWSEIGRTFFREAVPSPVFWLLLVVTVASLVKRKTIIVRIQGYAERLRDPLNDRLAYSLRAMSETLVAALPWPLLLATLGWLFRWATPTSKLSYAIGLLFLGVSLPLYFLRVLSMMCIPRGLAEAHFRWPECDVRILRVALDRLACVYVPTVLVVGFASHLSPLEAGGLIARLAFVLWCSAFAMFFYHVFQFRRGSLTQQGRVPVAGMLMRTNIFWCTLLLILPLGLAVLALTGYVYSAIVLSKMFLQTLCMLAGLVVLHQLTMRSLCVVRRRLAYAAAEERREVAAAARACEADATSDDPDTLSAEETEVDLTALSDDTGELVKMVAIAAGLAGLYVIWHEVVPALRIFNEVTLWRTTLGNIGLAILAVIGTTILARRLPAVSEIVMLRFSDLPAGSRHATTTLITYAIVTLGALFALNAIGLRWSQFQWLVAALGVGIGFGLQEMVANFISGLIILFERPIRVGDVVTVGETDGVVTRIRIRATTIRGWDHKELLVPNKEFITGRLLNWTLSDQVIRIIISVGVAYGSDTDKALALMKAAATEHADVLEDPAPLVTFEGFGDNSLSLTLRAYLGAIDKRIATTTDLHRAVDRKFRDAGIVIAFPQRDVHLDISEPVRFNACTEAEDGATARAQDQNVPERNEP